VDGPVFWAACATVAAVCAKMSVCRLFGEGRRVPAVAFRTTFAVCMDVDRAGVVAGEKAGVYKVLRY